MRRGIPGKTAGPGLRLLFATWLCAATAACAGVAPSVPIRLAGAAAPVRIDGLGACSFERPSVLDLDPSRPVVVLVHGCRASGGRFRSLAEVFELHEQQTICFDYDDRERITKSGTRLARALRELGRLIQAKRILVLGHSQGGLVARWALSEGTGELHTDGGTEYGLVTVSSPFNGIAAASDCGSRLGHTLSLGITVGVCYAVTGAKWSEIHPRAALVTAPPALRPVVQDQLTVITDERESCRRAGPDGRCLEDDFVFSLEEQAIDRLRFDRRVQTEEVAAGHVEIVGAPGVRPAKLLSILKRHGILEPTPSGRELAFEALLRRLF
jgi:pimeloyl-ACP methyl ester carboxylesterase